MPRYVILEHDWPTLHWDLLLEAGDVLRAWRLPALPKPGQSIPAEVNVDHRLMYLDYEGPVSGDRGRVKRIQWGEYISHKQGFELGDCLLANVEQRWWLTRLESLPRRV